MKVAIWDTYVLREDGKVMHFDILVSEKLKDEEKIFNFGRIYLKTKPFETKKLTTEECKFCHIEEIKKKVKKNIFNEIKEKGYSIIEFENCD